MMDNIFDVTAALEGKPESKDFDEIIEFLNDVEAERDFYRSKYMGLKLAFKSLKEFFNDTT